MPINEQQITNAVLSAKLDGLKEENTAAHLRLNAHLEKLYKIAMDNGADGAKITGAGGGGMFVVYANWDKRCKIIKAMEANGCKNIDFNFRQEGLQTWSIRDEKNN